MIERIAAALARLSVRERGLIIALMAVVVPIGLFFGVVLPLAKHQSEAEARVDEAASLRDWVTARAVEAAHLSASAPAATEPRIAIGVSGVEQSLVDARLRQQVSRLAAGADGAVELSFDAVNFVDLTDWLSRVEGQWGYVLASFRFERLEEGNRVAADFVLSAAP